MKLSAADMIEIGQTQYADNAALREHFAKIDDIRFRRHKPALPDAVAKRAKAVYMDVLGEKERKATVLLTPPEGPRFLVDSYSSSQPVRAMRETVQNWLVSSWRLLATRGTRPLYPTLVQDILTRSAAMTLTLPHPDSWKRMPDLDLGYAAAIDDEKKRAEYIRKVDREQEAFSRRVFPIVCEWVPMTSAILVEDEMGEIYEVWDYRVMPVRAILEKWKDKDGKPLAKALAKDVDDNHTSMRDTCAVLYRADEEHIQIATVAMNVWGSSIYRSDAVSHGVDQMVASWAHGMGMNPYAFFPGRQRNTHNPVDRWDHFHKPNENLAPIIDDIATQVYAAGRAAAYATTVLKANEKAGPIGASEKAPRLTMKEGAVNRLPPGYDIVPIQQTSSSDFQRLSDAFDIARRQADIHTFTAAAYGVGDAESGYLQNQLESATKQVLHPFAGGMSIGMTATSMRMLAAARVLLDNGAGAIPVRNVDPRSGDWVTLRPRHVEHDWFISVEIEPQPVGGKLALIQSEKEMVASGWKTNREAMEALGNDHPERTTVEVMAEKLVYSQENMQLLSQAYTQRVLPEIAEKSPGVPNQPRIGQGLAAITQSPQLRARLGTPNPGAPNQYAQDQAPGPAVPRQSTVAAHGGGPTPGESAGTPQGVPLQRDVRQGAPV